MKISKFNTVEACEKGAWLTIQDFDEMDTDIEIKVIGVDSKVFKKQVNKLARQNEGKKVSDADKLEAETIRTLVAITTDWKNVEDDEDKAVPFSKEAVEIVYTESPYICAQIIKFASDRTNFLD
jgi:kynurenine formamidase